MKYGIDISEFQGHIDWERVKQQVDYVIVRLGYGRGNWDDNARENIEALNRLQIPYGLYWFSYAYTEEMAKHEAESVLRFMEECTARPVYPVYFDWEGDSKRYAEKNGVDVSGELLRNMTTAFMEEIESGGYKAGLYASDSYCHGYYGREYVEAQKNVWYALYGNDGVDYGAQMWQYSSSGSVEGISGRVDVNYCYYDYEDEEKEESEMKRFDTIEEAPGYSHGTLNRLQSKGVLLGRENGKLDLSEDMIRILVMMDRAGVFKNI